MVLQQGSRRLNASSTCQIVDTTRRHDCPGGNPPRRPVARSVTVYRTTKVDNVDALLLSNQDSVFGTVGQSHRLVPVAQGSRNDIHALASHRGELRHPEPVPPCVVRRFRETRVEANLARRPAIAHADRPTQCVNVVVGIGAVKGGSGGMEEILAVNKHRGALDWRLSAHAERKNNPARGLSACPAGRKSRATIPARQTDVQAGRPVQRLTTGSRYVRPRSPVHVHYEIQAHSLTARPQARSARPFGRT